MPPQPGANDIPRNHVPGRGLLPAPVMLVGEAPGRNENSTRMPFVGQASQELERYARTAGLDLANCYITNLCKMWPPVDFRGNQLPPTPEDIARDEPELLGELMMCEPRVIVAVGAHATRYFLGDKFMTMRQCHGIPQLTRIEVLGREVPIIAVLHPAAGLHSGLQEEMARIQWDFQQVGKLVRGQLPLTRADEFPAPQYRRLFDLEDGPRILANLLAGRTEVAIDTEGTIEDPECLTLAVTPGEGWMVEAGQVETLAALDRHINAPHAVCTLIFHYLTHDIPVVEALGVRVAHRPAVNPDGSPAFRDTMNELHLLGGIEPKGLKAAEWRLCGMEADSFEDVCGKSAYETARDYFEHAFAVTACELCVGIGKTDKPYKVVDPACKACGGSGRVPGKRVNTTKQCACVKTSDACEMPECVDGLLIPAPAKELNFDATTGEFRWKQPQSMAKWLKRKILSTDLLGDGNDTDDNGDGGSGGGVDSESEDSADAAPLFKLRKAWRDLPPERRALIERVAGKMPRVALRNVKDQARVTAYACLNHSSVIMTEHGSSTIGRLVRTKSTTRVWSVDADGKCVLKPIVGWHRIGGNYRLDPPIKWFSVRTEFSIDGRWGDLASRYTSDHKLMTRDGWKRIDQIQLGDEIATGTEALTAIERQIVLGSVLGDGSLCQKNPSGGVQFTMSHAQKQLPYLEWKASLFGQGMPITKVKSAGTAVLYGRQINHQAHFAAVLPTSMEMLALRRAAYSGRKNEITIGDWAAELDWLGLAILYQDDGCLVKDSVRIYTLSMSHESIERLREIMSRRFNLGTSIYNATSIGRTYTMGGEVLTLPKYHSDFFFQRIAQYVHPCMRYKLPEKYHGFAFDERPRDTPRGQLFARVIEVYSNPVAVSHRGSLRTSYCIDVQDTHNFITASHEVAHNCRDADATLRVSRETDRRIREHGLIAAREIDIAILPMLSRMERNGMMIDRAHFEEFHSDLQRWLEEERTELANLVGEHNPNSKRMIGVLFRDLELPAIKMTAGGQESTDDETLGILKAQLKARQLGGQDSELVRTGVQVIDCIQTYREFQKMDSTYVLGLLGKADMHDRVHTTINYTKSVSRLSSKDPNLQNIPNPDNSPYPDDVVRNMGLRMRRGFIARPGCKIIEADYSAIEMVVGAHLTQDRNLMRIFREGLDPHRYAASQFLKMAMADVPKPVRTQFKTLNFASFYDTSAMTIQRQLSLMQPPIDMSVEECQQLINWYFSEFAPDVLAWKDRMRRDAQAEGVVRTMFGRMRWMPGLRSQIKRVKSAAERECTNFPIQGTARDILCVGMARMWEDLFPELWVAGVDAQPIMTVHDAVAVECPSEFAEFVGDRMRGVMESAVGLSVPVKVSVGIGDNWAEAH